MDKEKKRAYEREYYREKGKDTRHKYYLDHKTQIMTRFKIHDGGCVFCGERKMEGIPVCKTHWPKIEKLYTFLAIGKPNPINIHTNNTSMRRKPSKCSLRISLVKGRG